LASTSLPSTNWEVPTGVPKLACQGMSPPLPAAMATLVSEVGEVGEATARIGARSSRSPGRSQKGSRSPSLGPGRAGTRGKSVEVPSVAQLDP